MQDYKTLEKCWQKVLYNPLLGIKLQTINLKCTMDHLLP
jgi:hypothetical protein